MSTQKSMFPLAFAGLVLAMVLFSQPTVRAQQKDGAAAATDSTASDEAERDKIWNSPEMLKARAWMEEYFSRSAKVTPEQAAEYRKHLAAMTAPQMKIWLMKFEEDQEQRNEQEKLYQQSRQQQLAEGEAENAQDQKAYNTFTQDQSKAATAEQNRLKSQQQFEQQMQVQRSANTPYYGPNMNPGFPYGYGYGLGGYNPTHYHYHYHY